MSTCIHVSSLYQVSLSNFVFICFVVKRIAQISIFHISKWLDFGRILQLTLNSVILVYGTVALFLGLAGGLFVDPQENCALMK